MKINSNYQYNHNQNFTAIRIVKVSPQEFIQFNKNFKEFCRENILFKAESMEQALFLQHLSTLPQKENASFSWIINNATRHNLIDSDTIEKLPMCVFTGKDKMKLALYNLKNFIPNLMRVSRFGAEAQRENFPQHLRYAKALKQSADFDMPKFKKFLKKNNAKNITYDEFVNEVKEGKL